MKTTEILQNRNKLQGLCKIVRSEFPIFANAELQLSLVNGLETSRRAFVINELEHLINPFLINQLASAPCFKVLISTVWGIYQCFRKSDLNTSLLSFPLYLEERLDKDSSLRHRLLEIITTPEVGQELETILDQSRRQESKFLKPMYQLAGEGNSLPIEIFSHGLGMALLHTYQALTEPTAFKNRNEKLQHTVMAQRISKAAKTLGYNLVDIQSLVDFLTRIEKQIYTHLPPDANLYSTSEIVLESGKTVHAQYYFRYLVLSLWLETFPTQLSHLKGLASKIVWQYTYAQVDNLPTLIDESIRLIEAKEATKSAFRQLFSASAKLVEQYPHFNTDIMLVVFNGSELLSNILNNVIQFMQILANEIDTTESTHLAGSGVEA